MSNLLSSIFQRLSLGAVTLCFLAMLTLGSTLWGLTHWAAEPGTTVKVLFGLTEYTKSASRLDPVKVDAPKAAPDMVRLAVSSPPAAKESISEQKPARTIDVFHDIDRYNVEKFLSTTRERLAVRELSPMETGKTLGDAPKGTRFYVPYNWLRRIDGPQPLRELEQVSIFRESFQNLAFETYHPGNGGIVILAFTTEAEAVGVRNLNGRATSKFLASPMPWGASTSAMLVPVDRIVSMRSRELEIGGGARIGAADTVLQ